MKRISLVGLSLLFPLIAGAQAMEMDVGSVPAQAGGENILMLGHYFSTLLFLSAALLMGLAVRWYGASVLGSIFSYLAIGTGILFAITVFQGLGGHFFAVSNESMDIWSYIMLYMALGFYLWSFKLLVGLGSGGEDSASKVRIGAEKKWGIVAAIGIIIFFLIPSTFEPAIAAYNSSAFGSIGIQHFIALIFAWLISYYLIDARAKLGKIGLAVAVPTIVAVWSLGFQHFWMLFMNWGAGFSHTTVTSLETAFLFIAAVGSVYAAWRLLSFTRA